MADLPGGVAPDENIPPPNQDVLDAIFGARAWHEANVNIPGSGQGGFKGNEYFEAAAQPGMSGYFQVQGGSIVPRMMDPRQVAAESGQSLGQLAGTVFPRGDPGHIGYNIPEDNDRGGFFSLQDLFNYRQGGAGVSGVPQIGTFGQSGLSTNNWRLLGRGPGWAMRNGMLINTMAPEVSKGMWPGADMGFGATAEHGPSATRQVAIGTGHGMGMPGYYLPGNVSGWPGQASGWI